MIANIESELDIYFLVYVFVNMSNTGTDEFLLIISLEVNNRINRFALVRETCGHY